MTQKHKTIFYYLFMILFYIIIPPSNLTWFITCGVIVTYSITIVFLYQRYNGGITGRKMLVKIL